MNASGNWESGWGRIGWRNRAATMIARKNVAMKTKVAGAQIVVDSGIRPVCFSRKWPGVFIRSGALAESPNCQIDPAADVVASRNGKSTSIPFFSASRAK